MSAFLARCARALRKPPHVLAHRLWQELQSRLDVVRLPARGRSFGLHALLESTESSSLNELWERLLARPHAVWVPRSPEAAAVVGPAEAARVQAAAARAHERVVDLLGSGPVRLGEPIDWHTDFKSGLSFPTTYARHIDYADLGRPSDVKVPWELSRLQWLLPVAQAYALDGDEAHAQEVRRVLESWMAANPVGLGVQWGCTMEAAMRIFTWSWLLHVLGRSYAWNDAGFRERFLCCLYLHGEYAHRYLEYSDINGNHCTADAAAMHCAGLLFGQGAGPTLWTTAGWRLLCDEMPRQVTPDGVDFEGSIAYHRLVMELFLLAALHRQALDLDVPAGYQERLHAMAGFVHAYARPDGSSPLLGDADDARVLPLGGQARNDHRYLVEWLQASSLGRRAPGGPPPGSAPAAVPAPHSETLWMLGPAALAAAAQRQPPPASQGFAQAGYYVMRNAADHVFIDGGPIGQGGRGGHGHNDCLAFECMLDGVLLVVDSGVGCYTGSPETRNRFRSSAAHNAVQIDGAESNPIEPHLLWSMRYDAVPDVLCWQAGPQVDCFEGSHRGYRRLSPPITPVRRIELHHAEHLLVVHDRFEGEGSHRFDLRLHLAPGVRARRVGPQHVELAERFELAWEEADEEVAPPWLLTVEEGVVSPSYGVQVPVQVLHWHREGQPRALTLRLRPQRPQAGIQG